MNAAWGNPGKWGAAGCSSALAQAGVEGGGLHCEVVGTALAEGFEIAQLPAQCRQLSGVLALHQRPVRFCAHQPAQKLLVRGAQSLWQLAPQPGTSVEQYLQGAVHFGHSDKGPPVLAGDVLVVEIGRASCRERVGQYV